MKVLYYDLFCGISGDMNLGALVDVGVDFDYLQKELKKLNIDEEFELVKSSGMKHGIKGTKVDVVLFNQEGQEQEHNHHGEHSRHSHKDYEHGHSHKDHEDGHSHKNHEHEDGHSHKNHEHEDGHTHKDHSHKDGHMHKDHNHDHHHKAHSHEHRNFALIRDMIMASDLSSKVKDLSVEIFRLVAEAEGKVHGKPLEEVHFHEVGATDSIVDIVGAAICIDALNVDKVIASSVQVGGGFVKCAHGKMPVPAPATAEILAGVPMKYNVVPFETTTPTGAAILKATVEEYNDQHQFSITKIGYGLGNKDFDIPNILRVYLGEMKEKQLDLIVEEQFLMECNLDDMSGELFTHVEEQLFQAGALDVFKTPIMMKKGRPATKLSVLFKAEDRNQLQKIVFTQTTTAGVRETKVTKYMMERDFETITTKYGDVRVKQLYLDGVKVKSKPEYEDCLTLAKCNQVSLADIYREMK